MSPMALRTLCVGYTLSNDVAPVELDKTPAWFAEDAFTFFYLLLILEWVRQMWSIAKTSSVHEAWTSSQQCSNSRRELARLPWWCGIAGNSSFSDLHFLQYLQQAIKLPVPVNNLAANDEEDLLGQLVQLPGREETAIWLWGYIHSLMSLNLWSTAILLETFSVWFRATQRSNWRATAQTCICRSLIEHCVHVLQAQIYVTDTQKTTL